MRVGEKVWEREGGRTRQKALMTGRHEEGGGRTHLLNTALSFLVSTLSRMVSLPAPVVMVSVVTVSLLVDSVLPSSSSLSELLEEELSDATSGAFLATHTLHTHAEGSRR